MSDLNGYFEINSYLEARKARFLTELCDFLRIPSVSTDPAHQDDVQEAADFAARQLVSLGFDVEVKTTPGHPLVFAERHVGADKPTVLIYGHYDVQPADPLALWETPPFEPTLRQGAVYARGACDDKGQVFAHIKGVEALLAHGELPLNVKFLLEGEEEIGSPNLVPFVEANKAHLGADVVLISDGAMVAPNTPTITYGLKGLAYLEVRVKGAALDLHSGAFGGAVPNPINALAKMIAALTDESGKVLVPGFYDEVIALTSEERDAFKRAPFDEEELKQELGLEQLPGEAGYTALERLWARPTLDCNGVGGGFQGEGAKTVIPSEAFAKLSCRLVPKQTPADITRKLTDALYALAPEGVTVEVKDLQGGEGILTPLDSPAVQKAAKALEKVFGKPAVFARSGGTIPIGSTFQKVLGAEVLFIGMGLESDRIHSPNEKFDLENYYRGIEMSAALLQALAED